MFRVASLISKQFDLIVASVLFLVATSASLFAFAAIHKAENPQNVVFEALSAGDNSFVILAGADCVGEISVRLADEDTAFMRTNAVLRASSAGRKLTVTLLSDAHFNPLGQLMISRTKVTSADTELIIKTSFTNPIQVEGSATFAKKKYKQSLSLPGPITLDKAHGKFRLAYARFPGNSSPTLRSMSESLIGSLHLRIAPAAATSCPSVKGMALDLTPLVQSLSGGLGGLLFGSGSFSNQQEKS